MSSPKPPLARRFLAAVVDLYHFFYVALLPLMIVGAIVVFREDRMIRREVERARAMPKGHWKEDPARAAELSRKRIALLGNVASDLWRELQGFFNRLTPSLDQDEQFKKLLDAMIRDRYTQLATDTVERGVRTLRKFVKTPDGNTAAAKLEGFVREEVIRRIGHQIQQELDYRISQVADFLGFQGIGDRLRAWISARPSPTPSGAAQASEALEWTNLLDKILGEQVDILPETRANISLLQWAALGSLAFGLLYLALRDAIGRGRSSGKRQAGLKVVDGRTEKPASTGQLVVRGVVLVLLLPLEILLAAADMRIGDRVAGTRLVAE